jgi:acetolactate synthase-1/2/3 large subunit
MPAKQENSMTTVAEKWVEVLARIGVRYVFGNPSGPWVEYMEAMRTSDLEFVLVSNEASAGFMADVCGRITGIPGACYGTFGPGATNLSTGVGGALLDRSPLLAFTHEMPDAMLGRTTQMGIDHQALFRPITKWTTRLGADRVEETLLRAVNVATSEAPGPVHIGLPSNLGTMTAGEETFQLEPSQQPAAADPEVLDRLVAAFTYAKKPVLAVGLTAVRAGVQALVVKIAESHGIPVVLTPMAKGILPEDHRCYVGVLFHALSNHVAETHRQADLVIGVGYDPVELNYEDWVPDAPLVHIDTKPADLDESCHRLECDVVGNLRPALERLAELAPLENDWDLDALSERRRRMFASLRPREDRFGPTAAFSILREILPDDGVLTSDVGAHLHVIGQLWQTPALGSLLMTNGWSSMGFGIPAAIAASLCLPDRPVACVVGDGGFLMMVGEMATAKRLGVPVVFVLLTDHSLELIRIKQEGKGCETYGTPLHGESYDSATTFFGVPVLPAHDAASYRSALDKAFAAGGPIIVEAFVDPTEYGELVLKGDK